MRNLLVAALLMISGSAMGADSLGKTPVKTATKTDVQVQIAGQDGTSVQQVSPNNTAPAGGVAGAHLSLPAIVQSSLPTYSTNGNFVGLTVDGSGQLYVKMAANSSVNLAQVNGATHSATNPVFSQLTDGTSVYVGAKTGQLPTAVGQTTMAASLPVTIASNQTALDGNITKVGGTALALGQTTMSASIPVTLSSNQSTISTSVGAPTGAAIAVPTVVNIGSGTTTTIVLKASLAVSQPTKAYKIRVTGLSQAVCLLQYNDNATITKLGYLAVSPTTGAGEWACVPGFPCGVTTSATATTQQYEASCTNVDSAAADFHGEIEYCQAASGC